MCLAVYNVEDHSVWQLGRRTCGRTDEASRHSAMCHTMHCVCTVRTQHAHSAMCHSTHCVCTVRTQYAQQFSNIYFRWGLTFRVQDSRVVSYLVDVRDDFRMRGVLQRLAIHLQDFIPHLQVRLVRRWTYEKAMTSYGGTKILDLRSHAMWPSAVRAIITSNISQRGNCSLASIKFYTFIISLIVTL